MRKSKGLVRVVSGPQVLFHPHVHKIITVVVIKINKMTNKIGFVSVMFNQSKKKKKLELRKLETIDAGGFHKKNKRVYLIWMSSLSEGSASSPVWLK